MINEVDYRESSKIINIFTKEIGIIGVLIRGTKNTKSKSCSIAPKLTYGYFRINYKENSLSSLIEVDIIDNFKYIKADRNKLSYACFLLELATKVYKQDSSKNIYDILEASLIKINEGYDYKVITNIVEIKYLEFLGIKPELDKCISCKRTDVITISSYKGGCLCKEHASQEKIVLDKTINLIRMFYYVDISKISKLEISEKVKEEINMFIDLYYDRYAGLYLKSKTFLKDLENIK